jgi:precorrin-6A synthase
VRSILVIGIGPGGPDQLTLEAVTAIGRAEVVFVIDKGSATEDLRVVRAEMLRRHGRADHRVVQIEDPPRDRSPDDYDAAVRDWHARRADVIGRSIVDEVDDDGVGAFLVWGDPSLYDSTLRILDRICEDGTDLAVDVIPGVTSVAALAAAHRIPLHRIGEPVVITTGRRLGPEPPTTATVVMLDGDAAFTRIDPNGIDIFWGAYLGTVDEVVIAGPLADVSDQIVMVRQALREAKGWIMDVYLLSPG